MQTKEYLNQISRMNRMINNKLTEISQLREMACSISAIKNEERVQSTPNFDKIGTVVSKIVDMEKEVDLLVDILFDIKEDIYFKINMLSNQKHKEILIKKYIEFKSIYTIAEELGMTDRGCKKAHKRALEEFEKRNIKTKYSINIDCSLQNIV